MTLATAKPPRSTEQMTADEAKEITEAIRGNFDSLGKMLVEVRERKGYLALGYKSLESYCLTEFGKGKSRVYQLIEEFKIEEQIIDELAASDSPITSLKMPGTLLRELRELKSPREKIEAIAYANQLAENDGKRRATKTHLQVAVHKISGSKSEQTRQIITREMGFDKGVEVEVLEGYSKRQRGVIRKIDTKGQVHVELYSGNSMPIAWDVSNLRIVPPTERPQIPTTVDTINIGDKVRIFSSTTNKLKIGEIVARINHKQASVQIKEGHKIEIPYAELEKITENKTEQKAQDWENDLIWAANWNKSSWYYNAERREIKSFPCPGITFQIEENTKFANPSDWLEDWRNKYGSSLVDVLLKPDDVATLVMATAIKMSDTEKQEFLARINVLITAPALEAEQIVEFLVEDAAYTAPALEPKQTAEFLVEDEPNPNWQKDWLDSNFPVRPEIGYSVTQGFLGKEIADRLESLLDKADTLVGKLNSKKTKRAELEKTQKDINRTKQSIKDLEFFSNLQIGILVSHRHTNKIGIITNLTISTGGMPEAWVKWEELSIEIPEKLSLINIQDKKEEES